MREIKFKIWDKEQKKMLKPQWEDDDDRGIEGKARIHINADGKIFFTLAGYVDDDGWPYEVDCDIMQYTGLKDKNGVEIYEGDIVEHNKINEVDSHYRGHVLFDKSSWRVNWNDKSCIRKDLEFWAKARDIYVIGNIHENPELLEGRE